MAALEANRAEGRRLAGAHSADGLLRSGHVAVRDHNTAVVRPATPKTTSDPMAGSSRGNARSELGKEAVGACSFWESLAISMMPPQC